MTKVIVKLVALVCFLLAWVTTLNFGLRLVSAPSDVAVVIGSVVLISAIAVGTYAFTRAGIRAAQLFGLASIVLMYVGCGTTISPGHAGIIVDYYGKDRGVQAYTVTTGRVWYNPWTTSVLEWPTFVQSVVWTHNKSEGRPANEEITFTNKDQMQIAADVSLAYHLDATKLPEFYVKFRTADMDAFTYGYLHSLTRDKFNDIAGQYTIAQIMGDNGPFLREVKGALQRDLSPIGVVLESQFGFIGAPRPPDSVVAAINQQAVAQRLALTKENELRQVQADAAKSVARADGEAKSKTVWAEAEAAANRKIAESLSPSLIEVKRLEKWNGVLPVYTGAGSPFLSLKQE